MARAPLELLPDHVAGKILRFLVDAVALVRYRATSRALRDGFDDDERESLWEACCVRKGWGFATPDGPPLTETAILFACERGLVTAHFEPEWERPDEFPARRAASWAEAFRFLWSLSLEDRVACEWVLAGHADDVPVTFCGNSRRPREPLPGATLRVGDVIELGNSVGVVAGWDARARASWSWFSGSGRRRGQLREPHYAVLLDGGAAVYVVADAARRLEGERCRAIQHPDLGAYFDAFAPGVGYVPNERVQRTYPHDAQARRDALALAGRVHVRWVVPRVEFMWMRARAALNNPLAANILATEASALHQMVHPGELLDVAARHARDVATGRAQPADEPRTRRITTAQRAERFRVNLHAWPRPNDLYVTNDAQDLLGGGDDDDDDMPALEEEPEENPPDIDSGGTGLTR